MPDALPRSKNLRFIPQHWITFGLLVIAHAGIGAYWNPMGSSAGDREEVMRVFLIIGFLLSQPVLFAFWAAFAPQRFYQRFLWSFLLCTMVLFVEELGTLRNSHSALGDTMMPLLLFFVMAAMFFLIIRRVSRWQIKHVGTEEIRSEYQASQFGIKHLLILMTITALACGLIRSLLIVNPNSHGMGSITKACGFMLLMLALLLPIVLIPWYTMGYRRMLIPLIVTTMVVTAACDSSVYLLRIKIMRHPPGTGPWEQVAEPLLLMQAGAGLSVLVSTLVMRYCGFRMIRVRKATPATASKAALAES